MTSGDEDVFMTEALDLPARRTFGPMLSRLQALQQAVQAAPMVHTSGEVLRVTGPLIQAKMPSVRIGEMCRIGPLAHSGAHLSAEVIGFHEHHAMLSPIGPTDGVGPGTLVQPLGRPHGIRVGDHLLGHLLDGFGVPVHGPVEEEEHRSGAPADADPTGDDPRDRARRRSRERSGIQR
jgi:flagellar biosynthesis/type III secretory pathway ATPase